MLGLFLLMMQLLLCSIKLVYLGGSMMGALEFEVQIWAPCNAVINTTRRNLSNVVIIVPCWETAGAYSAKLLSAWQYGCDADAVVVGCDPPPICLLDQQCSLELFAPPTKNPTNCFEQLH